MDGDCDWSSQTNWSIVSGSLRNCLAFQSSLSLFDHDGNPLQEEAASATTTVQDSKSPLSLISPSPDSGPCEITINFKEKHELRQVYVRSTARVYEIYYAHNLHIDNEYLCTVRCGVAARDGEVLHAPSIQETASFHAEGSNKQLGSEENIKNEDDWVEVKVPDPPTLDSRNINSTNNTQALYEATAEINDASPCISVTLRLLSLQSKGCIYVDEIYVFGDPIDSTVSESQESRNENSPDSSLMAMFLPTLMQLTKTKGLSHLSSFTKGKQYVSEDDLEENHPSVSEDDLEETHPSDYVIKTELKGKAGITDPQEVKMKEVNGGWVGPSQPDTHLEAAKMESNHTAVPSQAAEKESNLNVVPSQIAEIENNHRAVTFKIVKTECNNSAFPSLIATTESNCSDALGGNVETALEKLISRMDRIEEICLGFEEKMVMPMSSIEARLQRVEQQLGTLTEKLQNSGLPSFSRVSAPNASCVELDANSGDNQLGYTVTTEIESDAKDLHIDVSCVFPDDISDSANTTQFLPGLVVKAPEFPDGEDEEDNADIALGQETNSSSCRGKQSIDDALSSALANFLSSSYESPKYTKSLTVKAPEFSNEDNDDHESGSEIEKIDPVVHLTDSEKINHIEVSRSDISLENAEKVNRDSNDKQSEEGAAVAEECGQFCGEEGDRDEACVKASTVAKHNPITGFNNYGEDENWIINCHKSDGLSSNRSDISNGLIDNQATSGSSVAQEGPSVGTDITIATEVPKKASHEDIIENVLGFSLASSVVNFETPLLDVKFISQRSPVAEPFLEALLVDMPETSSGDSSVKESSDDLPIKEQLKSSGDLSVVEQQANLVSVDDGELVNPASYNHFAVDNDYCTSIAVPVNIRGDNLLEDHKRKRDQIYTSSLI